jgi:uncharacterized membrane protein
MRQLSLGILVVIAGIGAIVFNRFAAEEAFKFRSRLPHLWNPSVRFSRIFVVVWGVIVVFIGLVVMANAWAWYHPFGLPSIL